MNDVVQAALVAAVGLAVLALMSARALAPATTGRLLYRLVPAAIKRRLVGRAERELALCDRALSRFTGAHRAGTLHLSDEGHDLLRAARDGARRRSRERPLESARSARRIRRAALMMLPEEPTARPTDDGPVGYLVALGWLRRRRVRRLAGTVAPAVRCERLRDLPELHRSLRATRSVFGLPWIPWLDDRDPVLVGPLPQVVALEGACERASLTHSRRRRAAPGNAKRVFLLYDDPDVAGEVDRLRGRRGGAPPAGREMP